MELNLKELSNQHTQSTTGVQKMRLSEDATSMVFQLFTKSIYSNPIGTVVREIASNCFDSHIEAKVNSPVIIKKSFDKEANTHYISFIDFGVGMSPDRVNNIYGVYFESTKRVDNSQIGGFGIGGKTPLAYKRSTGHGEGEYDNSFYVVTIFDKVKYYYCIYEGKESPMISLLHQEATTDHNGTEVRIPVLEKDIETFEKEMVRQLYYFENIIFEGFQINKDYENNYEKTLNTQYQIVRGKNFLFRGNENSSLIHVCLGKVAYPIDYNILGLNANDYILPLALKLEVGDINVIANREQLDYNETTIRTLKKKLTACVNEIKELIAKQYSNIVTLEDYFLVKNDFGRLNFPNGTSIQTGKMISQNAVDFTNFRYSFMKMPNDKQLFKFFFNVTSYGKKPSRRRSRYSTEKWEFEGGYEEISFERNKNLLYVNNEFNRKVLKQGYLKTLHELYHIVKKREFKRVEISELFNVHLDSSVDTNGKPVAFIQSLLDMQEEYLNIIRKHALDYDTFIVPDTFVISRKNKNVLSKIERNSTFPIKFIGEYSKTRVKVDSMFKYNGRIFYGTQEDEGKLRDANRLYCYLFGEYQNVVNYDQRDNEFERNYQNNGDKKTIMFVLLGKSNLKYMEFCKNAVHVNQFYNVMLRRKEENILSFFQTKSIIEKWDDLSKLYKNTKVFKVLNLSWSKEIAKVEKFMNTLTKTERRSNIGDYAYQLKKYFDIDNVKETPEQVKISSIIDDLKFLEEANLDAMGYISLPYDLDKMIDKANNTLVQILKKIMIF